MEETNIVVESSDFLHKKECNWITDIPYTPPNDYELGLLEGTVSPAILLQKEVEEKIVEKSAEQHRRDVITKIKIIALYNMNENVLCDPSTFRREKKRQLIDEMQKVLDLYNDDKDKVIDLFNHICNEKIFDNQDYTSYPIYKLC